MKTAQEVVMYLQTEVRKLKLDYKAGRITRKELVTAVKPLQRAQAFVSGVK